MFLLSNHVLSSHYHRRISEPSDWGTEVVPTRPNVLQEKSSRLPLISAGALQTLEISEADCFGYTLVLGETILPVADKTVRVLSGAKLRRISAKSLGKRKRQIRRTIREAVSQGCEYEELVLKVFFSGCCHRAF